MQYTMTYISLQHTACSEALNQRIFALNTTFTWVLDLKGIGLYWAPQNRDPIHPLILGLYIFSLCIRCSLTSKPTVRQVVAVPGKCLRIAQTPQQCLCILSALFMQQHLSWIPHRYSSNRSVPSWLGVPYQEKLPHSKKEFTSVRRVVPATGESTFDKRRRYTTGINVT